MKTLALAALAAIIASAAFAGSTVQRDAPTVTLRDGRGNVTGRASTYGNQTRFYDSRGNSLGNATTNGRRR
jgi:hypothetical protein